MNRVSEHNYPNGNQYLLIDCDTFEVELPAVNNYELTSIKYIYKKDKSVRHIISRFKITWEIITQDNISSIRCIKIQFKDQWGSEMVFICYPLSDVVGLFTFIGKGYNILPCNKNW